MDLRMERRLSITSVVDSCNAIIVIIKNSLQSVKIQPASTAKHSGFPSQVSGFGGQNRRIEGHVWMTAFEEVAPALSAINRREFGMVRWQAPG